MEKRTEKEEEENILVTDAEKKLDEKEKQVNKFLFGAYFVINIVISGLKVS